MPLASNVRRTLSVPTLINKHVWPFAAGAASASILWGIIFYLRQCNLENGDDSADSRSAKAKAIAEYIKSRIGELPRKPIIPMRWPWDRIRRHYFSPFHTHNGQLESIASDLESLESDDLGVCIGSIFGLDVGGTLAKLVYFDVTASPALTRRPSNRSLTSTNSKTDDDIEEKNEPTLNRLKKRSFSMFDLATQDHAKALESFYTFVNHVDTYGETGIKEKHLSFWSRILDGEFHFIQFETRNMEEAMELIKSNNLHVNIVEMGATGGGAHKYADMWKENLGISMKKTDELESLVAGMQFVLADGNVVGESYTFKPDSYKESSSQKDNEGDDGNYSENSKESTSNNVDDEGIRITKKEKYKPATRNADEADIKPSSAPKNPSSHGDEKWSQKIHLDRPLDSTSYPYLVVIIGTGVSILRVDGPGKHERISGSTIGGGTYLGLCRLLSDMDKYEDVMNLAEKGDPSKVDMTVGDIYGRNSDALESLGLPAWLVASSFGKLVTKQDPASGIKQEDLARALLIMVTNNIGQVAYLNAQLHSTSRLYFVGNFLRHNNISQRRLAYAIDYWSKGKMEALFLEHEGYFGALGAFLLSQNIPTEIETKVERQANISKIKSTDSLGLGMGGSQKERTNIVKNEDDKEGLSLADSLRMSFQSSFKLPTL